MRSVKIWTPKTDSDRILVEDELKAILASPPFSNSKRYPAFLSYAIEKSLAGQSDHLKERTLGVEVFGRQPDYDTNADPVVRVSAAEVRKRIAQYYHEGAKESEIEIELPIGSYIPTFKKRFTQSKPASDQDLEPLPGTADQTQLLLADPVPSAGQSERRQSQSFPTKLLRLPWVLSIGLLLALAGLSAFLVHRAISPRQMNQLWGPLVQTQDPVLLVLGCGKPSLVSPESPQTSLTDHMIGPYHHVSVSDAVAIARLANILQKHNRNYFMKEASSTSLADLRGRTVILIGALNNIWTMRLVDPLRYRFVPGTLARIEDRKNPQSSVWSVDYSKPFSSLSVDYGIVARYRDTYTNGNVLVIAGIGPYGTEAASEFVSSPQYLSQVEHMVPAGLQNSNLEMVIKTAVVNGEAGPPNLVAAYAF